MHACPQCSAPLNRSADEKDPSARRACFSIPIRDLDVSCAAPLLNYHAQQQQKQQRQGEQQQQRQAAPTASRPGPATTTSSPPLAIRRTPTDTDPASLIGSTESSAADSADDKSGSGGDFVLHVAFRTGPHSTHTTPTLVLQAPEWFTATLPPLPLPSWNPQAPLLEFVPLVRERLQQHLEQYCGAAAGKFQVGRFVYRKVQACGRCMCLHRHGLCIGAGAMCVGVHSGVIKGCMSK